LASGLNVSKEDIFVSPKQKVIFWKPNKFEALKQAAKWKVEEEIPEADYEEENSDFICDEGVKAQMTDRDVVGASVRESMSSSFSEKYWSW